MASEATRLSLSAEDIDARPRLACRAAVTLLHQLQHENVLANRCSRSAPWPFARREHGHDKRGHSKQSHNLCAAASAVGPPHLPQQHFSRNCRCRAFAAVAMFTALPRLLHRCSHGEHGHGKHRHRKSDNRERAESIAMASKATASTATTFLLLHPPSRCRTFQPSPCSSRHCAAAFVASPRSRACRPCVSAAAKASAATTLVH